MAVTQPKNMIASSLPQPAEHWCQHGNNSDELELLTNMMSGLNRWAAGSMISSHTCRIAASPAPATCTVKLSVSGKSESQGYGHHSVI